MKKITVSLILFWCVGFGFGQVQYSNYLDKTSEWRSSYSGGTYTSWTEAFITTYFDGVEIINGLVYYKEYSITKKVITPLIGKVRTETSVSGPNYIREDSTGKFYFLNLTTNVEYVTLDNQLIVNAKVGDTFPNSPYCTVQYIDTIYLGSISLKKLSGNKNNGLLRGTVEGIGRNLPCLHFMGDRTLDCYTKKGFNIQFGNQDCNSFPIPNRVNLSSNSNNISENELAIYPNPTKGIFNVISNAQFESYNYSLLNVNGSIVKKENVKISNQVIDISDLADGIYLLKIVGENSTGYRRIIKKQI